jgi:hypothetical protein
MSVPSYTYKCNNCDFTAPGTLLIGSTVYDDDGQHIHCNYEAAWCNTCESITPMELFKLRKYQFESSKRTIDNLSERTHGFLQNLLNSIFKSRQKYISDSLEDITGLLKYIELANRRAGGERCLKCGSHDAKPLAGEIDSSNLMQEDFTFSGQSDTGLIHPNCSGEIHIEGTGMRFSYVPSINIYNTDGTFREKLYSR